MSLREFAGALFDWQVRSSGPTPQRMPMALPIAGLLTSETKGDEPLEAKDFIARTRRIREAIAGRIPDFPPEEVDRIPFEISGAGPGAQAWYLGPPAGAVAQRVREAVTSSEQHAKLYVRLLLLSELALRGAIEATDTFIHPGFGSKVYLRHGAGRPHSRVLSLAEVDFMVREIVSRGAVQTQVVSLVTSKAFVRKRGAASDTKGLPSGSEQLLDAGGNAGEVIGAVRLNPAHFREADGRRYRMPGITLHRDRFRQTRLYYLNIVSEFAAFTLKRSGIAHAPQCFEATHLVEGGFVEPPAIARLERELCLVPASGEPPASLDPALVQRIGRLAGPVRVAGRETELQVPEVSVAPMSMDILPPHRNYLVFSATPGSDDDSGSSLGTDPESGSVDDDDDEGEESETIRVRECRDAGSRRDIALWRAVSAKRAYELLSSGGYESDAYTALKYGHVHARSTVTHVLQGIDASLGDLVGLAAPEGRGAAAGDDGLRDKLRRCLVEISLKEVLVGAKPLLLPGLQAGDVGLGPGPGASITLQLIATDSARVGSGRTSRVRALVSVTEVLVDTDEDGVVRLRVTGNRRARWGADADVIRMAGEFPFLETPRSDKPSRIRGGQFWVVDPSGSRLVAWQGAFVPKVVLNARYAGVEEALAEQDRSTNHSSSRPAGVAAGVPKTYSKGAEINLLPYYMSMLDRPRRGESPARKAAVQDCGSYLRVFVPPAGGLEGPGKNAMSNMRDVMIYAGADARAIDSGLIEHPLARLYLHTMTAGILVAGGNSKMSLLEKLARLPIEN